MVRVVGLVSDFVRGGAELALGGRCHFHGGIRDDPGDSGIYGAA